MLAADRGWTEPGGSPIDSRSDAVVPTLPRVHHRGSCRLLHAIDYPAVFHRYLLAAALLEISVGCHSGDNEATKARDIPAVAAPAIAPVDSAPAPPVEQWYRAEVGTDRETVPFFVSIPPPGTAGTCSIVNGDEHLPVVCVWKDASTIELEFPMFATRIQATRGSTGSLSGVWQGSRLLGESSPFIATRITSLDPRIRFPANEPATAAPSGDVSGTWKLAFDSLGAAKAVLSQTGEGVVTGSVVIGEVGDLRYMAGNTSGHTLLLSTFDGQRAYVIHAKLDAKHDSLEGAFHFSHLTDPFTGRRVAAVDITSLEKLRLRPGAKGVTIPQLDDPAYRDKPVIVDYFGTWCPGCIDETPFMADLYRRYHAQGLEVLSIALEATTDDAYNQRQVDYFRKHYGIPWRIVVSPGDFADIEKALPPELAGTGSFPVTIFLNRDHSVRAMHSGFIGPAAGEDHRRMTETYERHVTEILASPVRH